MPTPLRGLVGFLGDAFIYIADVAVNFVSVAVATLIGAAVPVVVTVLLFRRERSDRQRERFDTALAGFLQALADVRSDGTRSPAASAALRVAVLNGTPSDRAALNGLEDLLPFCDGGGRAAIWIDEWSTMLVNWRTGLIKTASEGWDFQAPMTVAERGAVYERWKYSKIARDEMAGYDEREYS